MLVLIQGVLPGHRPLGTSLSYQLFVWGVTFGLLRPVWTPQKNVFNLVVKRAPVRTVWAEFLVEMKSLITQKCEALARRYVYS